jgi:hypothetical protein
MASEATTILYRPVGEKEMNLIAASGFRAFPPRLEGQPIFYPVLTVDYATRIARDWNTRDEASGFVGYVLCFSVRSEFLAAYEVKTVGSRREQEYWIPAETLAAFNQNIAGPIEVVAKFLPGSGSTSI